MAAEQWSEVIPRPESIACQPPLRTYVWIICAQDFYLLLSMITIVDHEVFREIAKGGVS